MQAPEAFEGERPPPAESASPARQWSRTALALSILFASLPLVSKLIVGSWAFQGAAGLAILCAIAGAYLHVIGRRASHALPDAATVLDRAIRLAQAGETDQGIVLLNEAIRLDRWLWQAFQYRGEMRLQQPDSINEAIADFNQAIKLAPKEPHLYILRGYAYGLLGDAESATADYRTAGTLRGDGVLPQGQETTGAQS